ncbi:MAG: NYN domain-containing protein [Nitrospinota bacterium]
MARLALFVDGSGMFYAQRDNGWHLDYKRVLEYFADNRELYGAFYFTATPTSADPERMEKYRRFRRALIGIGYSVIDKEVKTVRDRETGQLRLKGNLDIELAFRLLTTADGWDELILMGGDSDFVPILEHLRNVGKSVVIVGRRESTALEVINVANRFINLNEIRSRVEKIRPRAAEPRAEGDYPPADPPRSDPEGS